MARRRRLGWTWLAAAALVVTGVAWFAAGRATSRVGSAGESSSAHLATGAEGILLAEAPSRDSAPAASERRGERRHSEDESPPAKPAGGDRAGRATGSGGRPPGRPAGAAPQGGPLRVGNVRPAEGGAPGGRVLAAGWTPAKESFPASSSARPNTSAARSSDPDPAATDPPVDLELATTHGLRGDYFDLLDGQISDLPDLTGVAPTFSRIDLAIDFDTDASFALPFVPDTFVVHWTGYLRAPEDGEYRFTCGSDDGARISIDGARVVDAPSLRPYAESSGAVKLTAGLHPIVIDFYENYGYASCRLWWDGPGWKRRIVAPEFFTPPDDLAGVVRPVIASIDPPAAFVEDVVTVRGVGFTEALRVTFNGVPAETASSSSTAIAARVPLGAATGDVVVRVGEISSLPAHFTVRNLLGLYAEYFSIGSELSDWPDFEHLAPFFVRLDPNLDFMSDNLWDLPYESDVFATRHTGFLYVPEDDEYRLTLGSDDGARVSLDGGTYLDMPGLHAYRETSRTSRLAKGFHPIEVIFFENRGAARLALYWQRPGDVTRTVIPPGFFYAPREVTDLPTPVVASIAPKAAEIGGEIVVEGSGFGTDARLVRVVFPGGVWTRPASVDDGRIRVRVPYGVASGGLHVEVGVESSNALPLTIATPQGLAADYMVFADRASIDAAIADQSLLKRPASFTRTETSWQRPGAKEWDLPFAMPVFAVHWHGTLAVEYPTDVDWILRAAAGAMLLVDDKFVVDCGPWHELQERYGRSHLAPGEHRFDLWLGQANAEPRLQLLYTPVGRLEHLPVPGNWFLPRDPR